MERSGTFVLRTASDAMGIRHYMQTREAKRAVVIGGGVLGIEAADALRQLGIATTLIARENRLMGRALDDEATAILQSFLESSGIAVRLQRSVAEVTGDEQVRGVVLDDGEILACDMVLTCIGIVPNVELAQHAGLAVNRGVVVDATMSTSDPAIYAVGDVAELPGAVSGLWPIGKKQGEIAAAAITGEPSNYVETHTMMHIKLAGIDVSCFGDINGTSDDHRHLTGKSNPSTANWRRVVVHERRIVGAIFVGETDAARTVGNALLSDGDHTAVIDALQAELSTTTA